MKHAKAFGKAGLMVVLIGVALSSVGCTDWKKKYQSLEVQYQELNTKHNTLTDQNKAVRMQLAQTEADKAALGNTLKQREGELATANSTIDQMKLQTGAPRPGGEITVYKKTVGSDILFSAGRATLTTGGKRALNSIVATIRGSYPGMTVRVYGYTDNDPIRRTKKLWKDNLDLSANRAMAVTRYLRSKRLDAERIETVAMGQTNPVASNSSKASKARNRRVVIVVIK